VARLQTSAFGTRRSRSGSLHLPLDLLTYSEARGLVISWGFGFVCIHMPQFCGVIEPHLCGYVVRRPGRMRATQGDAENLLMPKPLPPYAREYHGATGPSRLPLKDAVWGVLIHFRSGAERDGAGLNRALLQQAQLSGDAIEQIRTHVDGALKEMRRRAKPKLRAICRDREKYRDRMRLGEALSALDREERLVRDEFLRGLRNRLPRPDRRRLLSWIAHEGRAHMGMHDIDKRLFMLTEGDVDWTLDRICTSARE